MQDNNKNRRKKPKNSDAEKPTEWIKTAILMKVWTENGCKKSIWYVCENLNAGN